MNRLKKPDVKELGFLGMLNPFEERSLWWVFSRMGGKITNNTFEEGGTLGDF